MKRIIICCDGTWNDEGDTDLTRPPMSYEAENGKWRKVSIPSFLNFLKPALAKMFHWKLTRNPTNVVKIMRAIVPQGEFNGQTVEQIVYYDEGIGTGFGFLDPLIGGSMGTGLDKNIKDGYRFLVNNYVKGDQLYFFGFSRGAFTVRSLAGLIGKIGLLEKSDEYYIPEAFDHYRMKTYRTENELKDEVSRWAPKWFPRFIREPLKARVESRLRKSADACLQKIKTFKFGNLNPATNKIKLFRNRNFAVRDDVKINFLGVWDTVGALGIPGALGVPIEGPLAAWLNRNYAFHDVKLGKHILNAYQALAIDEKRKSFQPTLWNQQAAEGQKIEQVWFAGYHSNVGGGISPDGPENYAFRWMIEKAKAPGLELGFDKKYLSYYAEKTKDQKDALAPLRNSMSLLYRLIGLYFFSEARRKIGAIEFGYESIHPSVCKRKMLKAAPEYGENQPSNLQEYLDQHPDTCP